LRCGRDPAVMAGWAPTFLFAALGAYLLVKAANDSPFKPLVWFERRARTTATIMKELVDVINQSPRPSSGTSSLNLSAFHSESEQLDLHLRHRSLLPEGATLIKYQAPFTSFLNTFSIRFRRSCFQWTLPYASCLPPLTLGTFSRHSEITAMKAGGVSLYRIISPLLLFALLVSPLFLYRNEYISPLAARKSEISDGCQGKERKSP